MNHIKIIFFDIDGTLMNFHSGRLSDRTREALLRLRQRGILLCIATGRPPVCLPGFDGVEFDAFLTFNGSYCYNDRETIFSNPIPTEDVKKLIRNATAAGKPVSLATKRRLTANGTDEDLTEYFSFVHVDIKAAADFDAVAEGEVYQLMTSCREEEYPEIMRDVSGAKIVAWWDRAADIIPASGGKGVGIEKILQYYRLDRSQALAFGDGNNDIEMLQAVGTGVAMENASDQLKAVADEICGHVAQDGIYHYCVDKGLI